MIYDTVPSTLVPAIDKMARDQAIKYTGTFEGHRAENHNFNTTMAKDRATLVLTGLVRDGKHILASVREILLEQLVSLQTSFLRKPNCIMYGGTIPLDERFGRDGRWEMGNEE
ncbi:hypothetical protein AB5N19_01770 [Seiridium cardinale]